MNSNIDEQKTLEQISKIISQLDKKSDIKRFLAEILTQSELSDLSKRWRILDLLSKGYTQREIAATLKVSLCKVTRGAKILNEDSSICKKVLKKGEK